jgi:site-specific DNA-methyltransferase (adenine-specific)
MLDPAELDKVYLCDALTKLQSLPDACIDLIYIDPPFGSGKAQSMTRIRTGEGEQLRKGFGDRTYQFSVISHQSFDDRLPRTDYLQFLSEVLLEAHRTLKTTGSIYVHLDHHSVHYVKVRLDEIFGEERFLNEIIWAYDYGGRHRDRWPQKHDSLLWYAKSKTWTFNRDEIDRLPYMAPGLVPKEKALRGKLPTDVWWMTIVPTNSKERTGYPTQKPLALLRRIILASSRPGELVVDVFCGSGTTLVAAAQCGRHYIGADISQDAVALAQLRLTALNADKS